MWLIKWYPIAFLVGLTIAGGSLYVHSLQFDIDVRAQACTDEVALTDAERDCLLKLVKDSIEQDGVAAGFVVFQRLYQDYPTFSNESCHNLAHLVGDMVYYETYLKQGDITKVEFPADADVCGYGFYHGFFEHLFQDNPSAEFIRDVCSYVDTTLSSVSPAINLTCHHGAGHGLMMAQADHYADLNEVGVTEATARPIAECNQLSEDPVFTNECREGVFNIYTTWVYFKEYGLQYDYKNPFSPCEPLPEELYRNCAHEISRKFIYTTNLDLHSTLAIIQTYPYEDMHEIMFKHAVSVIVANDPKMIPLDLVFQCREFEAPFHRVCISSLVSGLFHHGITNTGYAKADQLCNEEMLTTGERSWCVDKVIEKLYFFHNPEVIKNLCDTKKLSNLVCSSLDAYDL